jgi:hypothetical protein
LQAAAAVAAVAGTIQIRVIHRDMPLCLVRSTVADQELPVARVKTQLPMEAVQPAAAAAH